MPKEKPAYDTAIQNEIAALMVQALNLDMAPDAINPDEPLYDTGLGLDSIDVLEVALSVSKKYGVELKASSEENNEIFKSLRNLTEYVIAKRTQ